MNDLEREVADRMLLRLQAKGFAGPDARRITEDNLAEFKSAAKQALREELCLMLPEITVTVETPAGPVKIKVDPEEDL